MSQPPRLLDHGPSASLAAPTLSPHSPLPGTPIADQDRYSRQILFPGIGAAGQQLLAAAHVAIVGVGATGAASASLLARAGIGSITLIDRDFVEPSNLQRQVLFDEADARDSLPKAEAARRKIALFNSNITVHASIADLVPAISTNSSPQRSLSSMPPITSRPATSSTTTPSSKANPGSTLPPSVPMRPP